MLLVLDADALRLWCTAGRRALAAARREIDELNVFPVPDGDTGTNLLLTMEAAQQAVDDAGPGLAAGAQAMAQGALMGARGNSGVLLAALLRGIADVLSTVVEAGPVELANGLARARDLAYGAVGTPVEGTMLTVARAAAEAAAAAVAARVPANPRGRAVQAGDGQAGDGQAGGGQAGSGLYTVAVAALQAATSSLTRTQQLLPALRDAGVVDAGGRGLCVLLEALVDVIDGRAGVPGAAPAAALSRGNDDHPPDDHPPHDHPPYEDRPTYDYEVQYLLQGASAAGLVGLRGRLGELGDSVVVAGTPELANVHVHVGVDRVGPVLEAGLGVGRPSRISVSWLTGPGPGPGRTGPDPGRIGPVRRPLGRERGVVAVAAGSGVARLFSDGGAVVVPGGPGEQPSTAEVLRAVLATGAPQVAALPNDADSSAVVAAAAREAARHGVTVALVPTRSPVQGLAALALTDPHRPFEDDVAAMAAAALATRWAAVSVAHRHGTTEAGPCAPGQALGLLAGRTVLVGQLEQVVTALVDRLLAGAELLTVVLGRGAPGDLGDHICAHVAGRHPHATVVVLDGGQAALLLLGAE